MFALAKPYHLQFHCTVGPIVPRHYYLDSLGWRDLTFYLIVPCFLPLLIFCYLSDSPRYLYLSGDSDGGRKALKAIFTMNGKEDISHLVKNVKDQDRGNVKQMFTPEFEKTTWLLLGIITIKNLVITAMHLALPFILQVNVELYIVKVSRNSYLS